MKHEAKSEALKKHLGNVICAECGSKKHKTKEHDKEAKHKDEYDEEEHDTESKNKKEINGDQE